MGISYSKLIYLANYDFWARPVTITPVASQPSSPAYSARGIYTSDRETIDAEGLSIITDQETILDIREEEFGTMPVQGDLVAIPADASGPDLGSFEVLDAFNNGGGETTLVLRKIEPAIP